MSERKYSKISKLIKKWMEEEHHVVCPRKRYQLRQKIQKKTRRFNLLMREEQRGSDRRTPPGVRTLVRG